MERSKVYFTNLRTTPERNILQKLDMLVRKAGIEEIDLQEAVCCHQAPSRRTGKPRISQTELFQGHSGYSQRARRKTLSNRLQYAVRRKEKRRS